MKTWRNLDWLPLIAVPLGLWGVALVRYLSPAALNGGRIWLGTIWLLALALAAAWLDAFLRALPRELSAASASAEVPPQVWLAAAITLWAVITLLLQIDGLTPTDWLLLACNLLAAFVWAASRLPAIGELALAIWGGFLSPAWLYSLLRGGLHPWLLFFGLSLTFLLAAGWIARDLSTFATDEKYNRRSLTRWLTWPVAITLHQALLASAYVLIAFAALVLNVPWRLAWPLLLPAVLSAWQALVLHNIANGLKPVWKLVRWNALAQPLLQAYLLLVGLWLA